MVYGPTAGFVLNTLCSCQDWGSYSVLVIDPKLVVCKPGHLPSVLTISHPKIVLDKNKKKYLVMKGKNCVMCLLESIGNNLVFHRCILTEMI